MLDKQLRLSNIWTVAVLDPKDNRQTNDKTYTKFTSVMRPDYELQL